MSYLILEDYDGNAYNFPPQFWIRSDGWTSRSNTQANVYYPGRSEYGDGLPDSRNLSISGILYSDSEANMETAKRSLEKACRKGGSLSISDDVVSRFLEVDKTLNFDFSYIKYPIIAQVNISFDVLFPYWQAVTESSDINVMSGSGTISVTNNGDDTVLTRVQIDNAADNASLSLVNLSFGSASTDYTDVGFLNGDQLIIDAENGTVKKNGLDVIENFDPPWLRLVPDVNTINYVGSAATVTIYYRELYL